MRHNLGVKKIMLFPSCCYSPGCQITVCLWINTVIPSWLVNSQLLVNSPVKLVRFSRFPGSKNRSRRGQLAAFPADRSGDTGATSWIKGWPLPNLQHHGVPGTFGQDAWTTSGPRGPKCCGRKCSKFWGPVSDMKQEFEKLNGVI